MLKHFYGILKLKTRQYAYETLTIPYIGKILTIVSRCWLFALFIVFLPFLCEINLQDSGFQVSGRRPQAIRIDCFISSICRLVFLVLHVLSSLAKGERLTAWDILNHLLNLVVVLLLQSWCHKMIWTNFIIIFYRSHIRRTFFSYDIQYFVSSN